MVVFLAEYLDSLVFEGREIIDRFASGFHFQIYCWGGLRISFASGKRLPASLSLSNDSDMGERRVGGGGGGGLNHPLQFTNVEADMAITAVYFRACL